LYIALVDLYITSESGGTETSELLTWIQWLKKPSFKVSCFSRYVHLPAHMQLGLPTFYTLPIV
jgi:hypothetical protein